MYNTQHPNWVTLTAKRNAYMAKEISHQEYYIWLSDFIGLNCDMIPFTLEQIQASKDEHLNDLPLRQWDAMDYLVRRHAFKMKLAWSLSDTVCCLKAMARDWAQAVPNQL